MGAIGVRGWAARLVLVLGLLLPLVVVGPGRSAPAGALPVPGTLLPIADARGVVVDPGTGRVFVSGDDSVVVRSATGLPITSIGTMYGAHQMVSAAGSIWVLLRGTTSIARINPATATVTGRWSLAPRRNAWGLAHAAGRIWTTAEHDDWDEGLFSLDPATGVVTQADLGPGFFDRQDLAASPALPDVVFGAAAGLSPVTIHRYRVDGSGGAAKTAEVRTQQSNSRSLSVTGDGQRVQLASGAPYHLVEYAQADLSSTGVTYPMDPYPQAVTNTAAVGGLTAAAASGWYDDPDVWVYRTGAPTPVASFDLSDTDLEIVPGGLAFAPDASYLYAVRSDQLDHERSELVVRRLAPTAGTPTPRVLGTRGGGATAVTGTGLAGASITVGGLPAIVSTTDNRVSIFAPALPVGPAPVAVTGRMGHRVNAPQPALVVDLGPFRDSAGHAERHHLDFRRRSATASERTTEDGALAAGAQPGALPARLARDATFTRHRTPLILLYQAVYLRPPDTSGIEYWVGRMEGGMAETQIAAFFASSREFLTRYGRLSDAAFVDRIYTNVLGRPPDAPGRAYWIDQLRRGMSRGKVVLLFAFSGEYRRQQTAAVDVVNLYLGLLRRAPTSVERTAGLAAPSLTTLATSIQRGVEYRARIG